jgi:hypothetical protein
MMEKVGLKEGPMKTTRRYFWKSLSALSSMIVIPVLVNIASASLLKFPWQHPQEQHKPVEQEIVVIEGCGKEKAIQSALFGLIPTYATPDSDRTKKDELERVIWEDRSRFVLHAEPTAAGMVVTIDSRALREVVTHDKPLRK